jgi:hypothetical protein
MTLVVPEYRAMCELRTALSRGVLPRWDRRAAHDWARLAAFHAIAELLRILDEFKRRIERGERCRLVHREKPQEPGRMQIEIVIEPIAAAPP